MERVVILGPGGAGKSELARALAGRTGLPVVYLDPRFARADTVFFLDVPRRTCLRRVLWRLVRDRRRSRPDLPDGASEGFDWPFLRWIWRYPHEDRPRVMRLLESLPAGVEVHIVRSAALTKSLRTGTTQRTSPVAS